MGMMNKIELKYQKTSATSLITNSFSLQRYLRGQQTGTVNLTNK